MTCRCAVWGFKGSVTFDLVKVKVNLQILSGPYLRNYWRYGFKILDTQAINMEMYNFDINLEGYV